MDADEKRKQLFKAYGQLPGLQMGDDVEGGNGDFDTESIMDTESVFQPDGSVSIVSTVSQQQSQIGPWDTMSSYSNMYNPNTSSSFSLASSSETDSVSMVPYYNDETGESVMMPHPLEDSSAVLNNPANNNDSTIQNQILHIPTGKDSDGSSTLPSSRSSNGDDDDNADGRNKNRKKRKNLRKLNKFDIWVEERFPSGEKGTAPTWIKALSMLFTAAFVLVVSASFISYLFSRYSDDGQSSLGRAPSLPSILFEVPTATPTTAPTVDYKTPLRAILEENAGVQFERSDDNEKIAVLLRALDWLASDMIRFESEEIEEGNPLMQNESRITQRFALVVIGFSVFQRGLLFEYLGGGAGSLGRNECDWPGVSCDDNDGLSPVITGLSLGNFALEGTIPSEIAILSSLTSLDFSDNRLGGSIPEEFYDLTSLQEAFFYQNQLTGTISGKLGQLSSLTHLHWSQNKLEGSIPDIIPSNNKIDLKLEYINLYQNQLTGSLPKKLMLPNLHYLDVGYNFLTGFLPEGFVKTSLELGHLHLDHNQFNGPLPDSYLSGLDVLETLTVDHNQLTGEVPAGGPATLVQYTLNNNLFTKALHKDTCALDALVEKGNGAVIEFQADCEICTCDLGGFFCADCL